MILWRPNSFSGLSIAAYNINSLLLQHLWHEWDEHKSIGKSTSDERRHFMILIAISLPSTTSNSWGLEAL